MYQMPIEVKNIKNTDICDPELQKDGNTCCILYCNVSSLFYVLGLNLF